MGFVNLFKRNKPHEVYRRLKTDRISLFGKVENESVKQLLNSPLPNINLLIDDINFLVFDFETTGFSCESDHILSMGWCDVKNSKVILDEAGHFYVNQISVISSQSATINHITPEIVKMGVSLDMGVERLLRAIDGKVAVAHGTVIEKQFLNHYFRHSDLQSTLPLIWLDTLLLEKSFPNISQNLYQQDYRLSTVRQHYDLPTYLNHNALVDAVATAELLMCQISRARKLKNISTLSDLLALSMPKEL